MLDNIDRAARRTLIGGSDAKIIMGKDYKALLQLWREKRGEAEAENFDDNLVVQLGNATEDLNVLWFEKEHPGTRVADRQIPAVHSRHHFIGCTLDGLAVLPSGDEAVFEGKFMLPWAKDIEEAAREKHYWQVQHQMMVTGLSKCFLSVITGGGKYFCLEIEASATDQAILLEQERKFWFAVQEGLEPVLMGAEAPGAPAKAIKTYNMEKSNAWAIHASVWLGTREAHADHEAAKKTLKDILPADAQIAHGHGVMAKRAKNGAVTLVPEAEQVEEDYVE